MSVEAGADASVAAPDPSLSTVAHGVSWTALGRVVSQALWYGSLLVLAILVPPGAFGIIAVGSVIVSVTTLLMESGTGSTIVVTPVVGAAELRRAVLRTGSAGIGLSAIAAVAARPIMDQFAHGADPAVLRVMVVAVALASFSIVPMALLKKSLNFRRQALVVVAAAVLASVAGILAGALGAGVWALVIRLVLYQALVTAFAWMAVLDILPRGVGEESVRPRRRAGATWFMVVALAWFVAQTFDNLIVGHLTDVTQLGLYALAFSLGLAPLTQISWQVGGVLFPALAATRDPELITRRTLRSMRMMALLLLPLLPPAVVLAPTIIPSALGAKWTGMVAPFQILMLVGVVQGVFNVLAESLAATGRIRARAAIDAPWAIVSVGALVAGTELDGIRGAALAHLVMLMLWAAAYVWVGGPRVGLAASRIGRDLGGTVLVVALQALVTLVAVSALGDAGAGRPLAAAGAALLGATALMVALPRAAPGLLGEGRELVMLVLSRRRRVTA